MSVDRWRKEIKSTDGKERHLTPLEDSIVADDYEHCVICDKPTTYWLLPENAPLCSRQCLSAYLKDPKVYDPRGIYDVEIVQTRSGRKAARRRKGKWEPSEEWIEAAQARIARCNKG
jgi:hypothetical protein